MAEYWCTEHEIAFFKKGKMKGYAHPIEETGDWCNMPEGQKPVEQPPAPTVTAKPDMSKDDWAEKDKVTRLSIESQVAFKGIMEVAAACIEKETKISDMARFLPVYEAALDWAMIHLGGAVIADRIDKQKPTPQAVQSKSTGVKGGLSSMVFPDAGKLMTAMKDDLKMGLIQITAATAGFDLKTEEGRKECWAEILKTKEENEKK